MIILVCGSRNWENPHPIYEALKEFKNLNGKNHTIIHGAAEGADSLAGKMAKGLGFKVVEYPARWGIRPSTARSDIRKRKDGTYYDAKAGIRRNLEMLDQNPNLVIAFRINNSRGTSHTIKHAQKRGIPVDIYDQRV